MRMYLDTTQKNKPKDRGLNLCSRLPSVVNVRINVNRVV